MKPTGDLDGDQATHESPCACRFCGRPGTLDHAFGAPIDQEVATEPLKAWVLAPMQKGLRRFAQVICPNCDVRGPKAEFDTSDEWPHIWADQVAIAKWNTLHWVNRKQAD